MLDEFDSAHVSFQITISDEADKHACVVAMLTAARTFIKKPKPGGPIIACKYAQVLPTWHPTLHTVLGLIAIVQAAVSTCISSQLNVVVVVGMQHF